MADWFENPLVGKIIAVVVGLVILVVLTRFVRRLLTHRVTGISTRYHLRKIVGFGAYLAGILMISIIFSDALGGLTVALGVAGAGIAFALQEVIASVAGWLAITFAQFYRTGDRVQLGGIRGDVIDIGMLRTTLMECGDWVHGDLYNGRVVRVANSFVFKEPVFNYSADFPFLWDEIVIPVRFGSDMELTRTLILGAATDVVGSYTDSVRDAWARLVRDYLIEDARVQPMVTMTFDSNWMSFTLRYVVEYKKRRSVRDDISARILDRINRSGNKVVLPSPTLELVEPSVLTVRPQEEGPGNVS